MKKFYTYVEKSKVEKLGTLLSDSWKIDKKTEIKVSITANEGIQVFPLANDKLVYIVASKEDDLRDILNNLGLPAEWKIYSKESK